MFKYYLYVNDVYFEVPEYIFKYLIDLLSFYFQIFKVDDIDEPSCESDLTSGSSLYYHLHNFSNNVFIYFGKVTLN